MNFEEFDFPKKDINYLYFSSNDTKTKVLNKIYKELNVQNHLLLSENEMIISTNCIMNNKKIKTPARTTECTHPEVCELKMLTNYVFQNKTCPLCSNNKKEITVDQIYIDQTINNILQYSENLDSDFLIINKITKKWRYYNFNMPFSEFNDTDHTQGEELNENLLEIFKAIQSQSNI